MRTLNGTDEMYRGKNKIKRGEMVLVLHGPRGYYLGRGMIVYLDKKAKRSIDTDTVEFQLAGYKSVYDYDHRNDKDANRYHQPAEAEISHSSHRMDLREATVFSKMLNAAVKYVSANKITVKDIEVAREYERKQDIANKEYERKTAAAVARRQLIWSEDGDDNYSEANGLFTIVPNGNPEYRQANRKYVLRGPSYMYRETYNRDKEGRMTTARKSGDHWNEVTIDEAFKTLEEAQKYAQDEVERLLKYGPDSYGDKDIRLIEEVEKTGRLVVTKVMKKRQKMSPYNYRDNFIKADEVA